MNGAVKPRDLAYVSGFYFALLTNGAGCDIIYSAKVIIYTSCPIKKSREPLTLGILFRLLSGYFLSSHLQMQQLITPATIEIKSDNMYNKLSTSFQSEVPTHIFYHKWHLKSISAIDKRSRLWYNNTVLHPLSIGERQQTLKNLRPTNLGFFSYN